VSERVAASMYRLRVARAGRQHRAPASCRQSTHIPIDAFIRNAPCAFNYIIYPIFVQCYVMGRFGHENGPFWMLAGAVLVLFFLPLGPFLSGPFWFAWAVFDLHWGRFGDGPFWSVPLSTAMSQYLMFINDVLVTSP